ncbi:glycoside hydrolase family 2 protein [Microbacterium sp.]|uniref:glycoside hydrolase family 2 protein n=1 Tax=Microbacterium sp. TaxID=51671 RepID=UPI003F6EFB6E
MSIVVAPLTDHWQVRASSPLPPTLADALSAPVAARVPGVVHTDLLAAGIIADPYLDNGEAELQWIGHTVWTYNTSFDLPTGENNHELLFEGLDTVATVTVNGREVLRSVNQHRTYRVDVTDVVHPTGNTIEVRFDSAWAYAEAERERLLNRPNAYPTPFNFIRKMAANFGWDWGPQLVTAGIWKPVSLVSWTGARISQTRVSPSVSASGAGVVDITARVDTDSEAGSVVLTASVAGVSVDAPVVDGVASIQVHVPEPELWWPRGLGEQTRYDLTIAMVVDGEETESSIRQIGFRDVRLDTSEDADGASFTISVNGTPIFIRGANWIPDDCFPSRIGAQRYEDRVIQAVEANVNLLRVWGGGIYESDDFYDICDEQGVLVWQDFLFACAAYPEEQPLFDEVGAEAVDNIVRLSSHPSLILWNGCNENIWGWFDWGWQEELAGRTWGLRYYEEVLPNLVKGLAPHVPYWSGSPYSGNAELHANDPSRGNMHIWDAWNRADYTVYSAYRPRFVSEFGYQGPPAWSTLTEWVHDEPLTESSPNMLVHQKADDGVGKIRRGMAPHLPEPTTLADWHYLAQLQQARAVSYGIEHFRSLKPLCMGAIVWQLNDCWPVVSWAAVDGDGRRKPLWHALRRAYADRIARITTTPGAASVSLVNDAAEEWATAVTIRRVDIQGVELAKDVISAAVAPGEVAHYPLAGAVVSPHAPTSEFLLAESDQGDLLAVGTWVEDKDLALESTVVDVSVHAWDDGGQLVTLTAPSVVRGLVVFADRIEPDAWVSDSDLTVVPGKPVHLQLHHHRPVTVEELSAPGVIRWLNEPGQADTRILTGVLTDGLARD